jgi:hypothetical protein
MVTSTHSAIRKELVTYQAVESSQESGGEKRVDLPRLDFFFADSLNEALPEARQSITCGYARQLSIAGLGSLFLYKQSC